MILLDTHTWIWWIDSPDLLGPAARKAIENARKDRSIYISCISTWEIHMLCRRGRLLFSLDPEVWIDRCERLGCIRFVPVDNEIARLAVTLPGEFHSDPADRIIVATAKFLSAPLATRDDRIRAYSEVKSVW